MINAIFFNTYINNETNKLSGNVEGNKYYMLKIRIFIIP